MDLSRAVNMSPPLQPAHPRGGARGTSPRDVLGVASVNSYQPLSGQVTGQQENGSWQESSSNVQTGLFYVCFFFFSLAIKGRRLNLLCSLQAVVTLEGGRDLSPLPDGSNLGLGKTSKEEGEREEKEKCPPALPPPAMALLMEQREIISLVCVHHLPTAHREKEENHKYLKAFCLLKINNWY